MKIQLLSQTNIYIINLETELFLSKERVRKNIFMSFSKDINPISKCCAQAYDPL